MKRKLTSLFVVCMMGLTLLAQTNEEKGIWKIDLTSKEEGVRMKIDLYEESIEVPGMDLFGPMNGYLGGKIYGVWMITSFNLLDDNTASLRFSNDLGSDTQECILKHLEDGSYVLELKGSVCVKKVVDRKLVKIKNKQTFVVPEKSLQTADKQSLPKKQ